MCLLKTVTRILMLTDVEKCSQMSIKLEKQKFIISCVRVFQNSTIISLVKLKPRYLNNVIKQSMKPDSVHFRPTDLCRVQTICVGYRYRQERQRLYIIAL